MAETPPAPPTAPSPSPSVMERFYKVSGIAKGTLILGILGFVISAEFSRTRVTNGQLVECSYTDIGAIGFGVLTGLAGAAAIVEGLRSKDRAAIIIGCIGIALCPLHIVRGLGIIGGPCN